MTTFERAQAESSRLATPALHIVRSRDVGNSRIGGLPQVWEGFVWPTWKGRSLSFLAQLDLREVAGAGVPDWLPTEGILYFFYDQEQSTWGFDPVDRGSWRVFYVSSGECSIEATAPADLDGQVIFPSSSVEFRRITTYPDWQRLKIDARDMSEVEFEQLAEMATVEFGDRPRHQMFGFPHPVQGDDMELECQLASNGVYCGTADGYNSSRARELEPGARDWRLLLQLDTDDDASMMWGDAGTLYFWVRENDARAGNFENVWMILQCG